ncbi:YbaK/EbsC family protein [Pseudomonas aeruginosa]|uniref:prolyl-tRNA synthetase associated domain-containing protein n=1 Tax=Pseudomonas aeruginosa TaxID=287 RepID=UPI00148D7B34|nr:YbaK/EbsC family protein [Pseudomonas aeruginosa]MEB5353944.1 YbaK/EbsC family protein [Pseudomonas aeruginosa]MEB5359694.1 YbaK/EbsC family protein [Pseudomonas aeruginosa]MEB5438828.1 YbaK/EbsC family protein [Pseudomonas aeruginosa]
MSAKMDEQALLALLRELAIDSQRVEHPAIASIEEYYAQGIELPDQGIKNLFLRNRKGTRHYLVLLDERKEADLPGIAEQIGESRLSFASVERLREYLGVELGCVTPFALVNDPQHRVEVLLDDAIRQDQLLGFHPLVNTATECIRYADLLAFLAHAGHEPRLIRV